MNADKPQESSLNPKGSSWCGPLPGNTPPSGLKSLEQRAASAKTRGAGLVEPEAVPMPGDLLPS